MFCESAVPDGALVSSLQPYILIRLSVYPSLIELALMDQQGQKEVIHFGAINLKTVRQFVNSINISWAAPSAITGAQYDNACSIYVEFAIICKGCNIKKTILTQKLLVNVKKLK